MWCRPAITHLCCVGAAWEFNQRVCGTAVGAWMHTVCVPALASHNGHDGCRWRVTRVMLASQFMLHLIYMGLLLAYAFSLRSPEELPDGRCVSCVGCMHVCMWGAQGGSGIPSLTRAGHVPGGMDASRAAGMQCRWHEIISTSSAAFGQRVFGFANDAIF